jgi:glycosyltransferase involved in cell wall biosynthesis
MKVSVSIIIPVFNAESTIDETLNSIHSEVIANPGLDWQVIAVDDGSTDSSLSILEEWKTIIPLQIEKLNHTGGPARPRNRGIDLATSKYIFFLDSDDVLLPNGLSAAVTLAEDNDSDVVLPRLKSLDGRGVPRGMYSENLPTVELLNSRIYWALNPMKLVKRSLLQDPEIRFSPDLKVGEDQPFSALTYLRAKNISLLSNPPAVGVRYTRSKENLTLKLYSPEDYFLLFDRMIQILEAANLTKKEINFLAMRHWEIEFARELFWNTLPLQDRDVWKKSLIQLEDYSSKYLSPETLKELSIRWKGIVGLIVKSNSKQLEELLITRSRALSSKNSIQKAFWNLRSNWIRVVATVRLPKSF